MRLFSFLHRGVRQSCKLINISCISLHLYFLQSEYNYYQRKRGKGGYEGEGEIGGEDKTRKEK